MGLWLYICEIWARTFSTAVVDGHAVYFGSSDFGLVCAGAAWLCVDDVLGFICCSNSAVWPDFFWSGANAGNTSGLAGSK